MSEKELTFTCTCTSELCKITVNPEWDMIELAFYEYSGNRTRWKQRLRHIWHIIRKGEPWTDYMDIRSEDARRIAGFLVEAADSVQNASSSRDASAEDLLERFPDPGAPGQ